MPYRQRDFAGARHAQRLRVKKAESRRATSAKRHWFIGVTSIALVIALAVAVLAYGREAAGKPSNRLTLLSSISGPQRKQQVAARIAGLRLMNYYPAADSWTKMWTNWNSGVLAHDFARIHALGANAVRIIVFPYTFGWPNVSHLMAVRFADTLKIAESNDLGVQVTLFDWWALYQEIPQSQEWLKAFLGPYASDPEIQLIELQNEVNPSDPAEIAWVRALLGTLRSVMPRTPSTVSISGAEPPAAFVQLRRELAGAPLDVADLHFYGNEVIAYSWMLAAKRAADSLPLFVGEIGFPSADNGPGGPEAAAFRQAHWFSVVFAAARAAGVSTPAPWTLYDFKPGTIPSAEQSPSDYNYGLYSAEGQWRPSVWVVTEAFANRDADISNLNFSLVGQDNMPMIWMPYLPRLGKLSYDPETGYLRPGSVRLSDTTLGKTGAPGFYLIPTTPAISGQLWIVSAWAKGINVNGTAQVALSWFNSNGSYIGDETSGPLPLGNPAWTQLVVRTRVPAHAAGVGVSLISYGVTGTVWFANVKIAET